MLTKKSVVENRCMRCFKRNAPLHSTMDLAVDVHKQNQSYQAGSEVDYYYIKHFRDIFVQPGLQAVEQKPLVAEYTVSYIL